MCRRRLDFAKRYAAFSLEDCAIVLFSDQTMTRQFCQRGLFGDRQVQDAYNDMY